VWNARVLLREMRECGRSGGYTMLKDYLRPQRQAAWAVAMLGFSAWISPENSGAPAQGIT
jgi:hypothetical protein